MKLIFIPGYGEDETIFDKIHLPLQGEKVFLNLWKLLPDKPWRELNVAVFARHLTAQYNISASDVLIGHSTGGWVALHIKHLVNCPVIQIASWTDRSKVVSPLSNRHLIYFAIKTGLYLNSFVLRRSVEKFYQDKPSKEIFIKVFTWKYF
jgi:hypothetical protein